MCAMQMMLADGPGGISPPYSSTACSLMSLLSAILSTLALTDAEKRHSSSGVASMAGVDTIASQTTDIVRSLALSCVIHYFNPFSYTDCIRCT